VQFRTFAPSSLRLAYRGIGLYRSPSVTYPNRTDLAHDLVLPTFLFATLGTMTWGWCSGFGGMDGCIFAGVTWGTAWWFIAHQLDDRPQRPYRSAWIILARTDDGGQNYLFKTPKTFWSRSVVLAIGF
jgi:hypothetical protein